MSTALINADHWVYIERQNDKPLAIGPYPTKKAADTAMDHSMLVDGFVEDDCLDCWTSPIAPDDEALAPEERAEILIPDLTDPHHTGDNDY